jgi:hypothetical protein
MASDPTPASSTKKYHKPTPFSSFRVSHQRHKRLVANSAGGSETRDDPFAGGPILPRLRLDDAGREFATSITVGSTPSSRSRGRPGSCGGWPRFGSVWVVFAWVAPWLSASCTIPIETGPALGRQATASSRVARPPRPGGDLSCNAHRDIATFPHFQVNSLFSLTLMVGRANTQGGG